MRTRLKQAFARGARKRVLLLLPAVAILSLGVTWASFSSWSDNTGNSIAAASDFVAPAIAPETTAKSQGGTVAYIRRGGTYFVYANVTDTGNPATGVSGVTVDVSNITIGQTSAPLASGTFTIGGTTYNRRTAQLTANAVLGSGAKTYAISATDNDSNSRTVDGSVTVDNTAPTATNVQATNVAGGQAGRPEAGDSITFTFSEAIEPASILAGWARAAENVTLRLNDVGTSDTLTIYNQANTAALPFGTVALNGNYVSANRTVPSTMTRTGNDVEFVLGTPSGSTRRENTAGAMVWTPSTTPYDRAANAVAATPATEAGPVDLDF